MITFRKVSIEEAEDKYKREVYSSLKSLERNVVVAFDNGTPVGHILWEGNLVTDLRVDESSRRKGVGSALLKHAEREMFSGGWGSSIVPSTDAQSYYERSGYVPLGVRSAFKELV